MRISHWLLVVALLGAGFLTVNTIAQNPTANQDVRQQRFEYGTITTQAIQEANSMVYTVTWNAGVDDVIGRSTNSIVDARRRLTAQLGGRNNSKTNLSVLLTTLGSDGWRLVESTQNEFGTTRILIRARR